VAASELDSITSSTSLSSQLLQIENDCLEQIAQRQAEFIALLEQLVQQSHSTIASLLAPIQETLSIAPPTVLRVSNCA